MIGFLPDSGGLVGWSTNGTEPIGITPSVYNTPGMQIKTTLHDPWVYPNVVVAEIAGVSMFALDPRSLIIHNGLSQDTLELHCKQFGLNLDELKIMLTSVDFAKLKEEAYTDVTTTRMEERSGNHSPAVLTKLPDEKFELDYEKEQDYVRLMMEENKRKIEWNIEYINNKFQNDFGDYIQDLVRASRKAKRAQYLLLAQEFARIVDFKEIRFFDTLEGISTDAGNVVGFVDGKRDAKTTMQRMIKIIQTIDKYLKEDFEEADADSEDDKERDPALVKIERALGYIKGEDVVDMWLMCYLAVSCSNFAIDISMSMNLLSENTYLPKDPGKAGPIVAKINKYLRNNNKYKVGAIAGIIANAASRSDLDPVKKSKTAYGLFQLDGSKEPLVGKPEKDGEKYIQRLINHANIKGDYKRVETQLELMEWLADNGYWIYYAKPGKYSDYRKMEYGDDAAKAYAMNLLGVMDSDEQVELSKIGTYWEVMLGYMVNVGDDDPDLESLNLKFNKRAKDYLVKELEPNIKSFVIGLSYNPSGMGYLRFWGGKNHQNFSTWLDEFNDLKELDITPQGPRQWDAQHSETAETPKGIKRGVQSKYFSDPKVLTSNKVEYRKGHAQYNEDVLDPIIHELEYRAVFGTTTTYKLGGMLVKFMYRAAKDFLTKGPEAYGTIAVDGIATVVQLLVAVAQYEIEAKRHNNFKGGPNAYASVATYKFPTGQPYTVTSPVSKALWSPNRSKKADWRVDYETVSLPVNKVFPIPQQDVFDMGFEQNTEMGRFIHSMYHAYDNLYPLGSIVVGMHGRFTIETSYEKYYWKVLNDITSGQYYYNDL